MSSASNTFTSGLDWLSTSPTSIRRKQHDRNAETVRDNSAVSQGVGRTADGDGDTDDATKAGDAAARKSFMQLLVSHGINPEEFRQSLVAGLGQADGTPADRAAAYKRVPSAMAVDTLS